MGDDLPYLDLGSDFEAESMSLGRRQSCFVSTKHELKCFGEGTYGGLGYENNENIANGNGEMGDDLRAVALGDFNVSLLADGFVSYSTCAVDQNEKWKCWGYAACKNIFKDVTWGKCF